MIRIKIQHSTLEPAEIETVHKLQSQLMKVFSFLQITVEDCSPKPLPSSFTYGAYCELLKQTCQERAGCMQCQPYIDGIAKCLQS